MVIQPVPGPPSPLPGHDPDVLIAVVTFNSASVIEGFLRAAPKALEGAGTATVIVVDNASDDTTTSLARAVAPWATVIDMGTNRGYAAGINAALSHTTPRRGTFVLNPDTVPSPGSVALLADAVEERPGVGIAVPRIVSGHGDLMFSLRREPTIRRALGEAILGGTRARRFRWASEVIGNPDEYSDRATADWATGAAMFLSTRAVETVGSWNEGFFLYSEETDYALRVRDADLRLSLVAGATVSHRGGDLNESPWLWSLACVNRVRLYRARHSSSLGHLYHLAVMLNEAVRVPTGRPTHRVALTALLRGVRLPSGTLVSPRSRAAHEQAPRRPRSRA